MQRNKKSLLNAITAVAQTVCNGILGIVFVKFVLTYFGSDFNGVNSTASQLVSILLLFEGGFTVATNVALFKPYFSGDSDRVDGIISATKSTFKKIGIVSLVIGFFLAGGYSFVINSDLPRFLIFSVFFLTILPVCFNFYYATKYRILLQAEQKEYVISIITLVTTALGYLVNIIAIILGCRMWFIRFTTMLFSLASSLLIGIYVKKHFPHINYEAKPAFDAIKGTKDVFAQKLTGVFYSTAPIMCITLTSGGTMLASVYAVYNSVFVLLKGVLRAVIDAPRLGIGELAAQDDKEKTWGVYEQYEIITTVLLFVFLTTAAVLIMPFISVYTAGVLDINYRQPVIAVLLIFITYFELLHMPSGHLMNMTGQFRLSRNFQILATVLLGIGFGVSFIFHWGLYGILGTVLLTAIYLCFAEVGFIHREYFDNKVTLFLRFQVPFVLVGAGLIWMEQMLLPAVHGYVRLIILATVVFIVNSTAAGVLSYLIDKECTRKVLKILQSIVGHPNKC